MSGFLSANEITLILNDFEELLNSPEASTIKARWITGHSEAYDTDYESYPVSDVPTWQTQDIKCIFHVITPTDKAFIDAGVLKVGDVVLYIRRNYDLTGKEGLEFVFNTRTYYPILDQPNVTDLIAVPLGNEQMCQAVACNRIKENG